MAITVHFNPIKDRVCAISRVCLRRGRLPRTSHRAHARGCASVSLTLVPQYLQGICIAQGYLWCGLRSTPGCTHTLGVCCAGVLRVLLRHCWLAYVLTRMCLCLAMAAMELVFSRGADAEPFSLPDRY